MRLCFLVLVYLESCAARVITGSELEISKLGEPPLSADACSGRLCARQATQSPFATRRSSCRQPRRTIPQTGKRRVRIATRVEIASQAERPPRARSMPGEVLLTGKGARRRSGARRSLPTPSRRACWGDHLGRSPHDALAGLNRPGLSPCRQSPSLPPKFLLGLARGRGLPRRPRLPYSRCRLPK